MGHEAIKMSPYQALTGNKPRCGLKSCLPQEFIKGLSSGIEEENLERLLEVTQTPADDDPVTKTPTDNDQVTQTSVENPPVNQSQADHDPVTLTPNDDDPVTLAPTDDGPVSQTTADDYQDQSLAADESVTQPLAKNYPANQSQAHDDPVTQTLTDYNPVTQTTADDYPVNQSQAESEAHLVADSQMHPAIGARKKAKLGLQQQATQMLARSARSLRAIGVGDNVSVPVSQFDRKLVGVVLSVEHNKYVIETKRGVIKGKLARNQI